MIISGIFLGRRNCLSGLFPNVPIFVCLYVTFATFFDNVTGITSTIQACGHHLDRGNIKNL